MSPRLTAKLIAGGVTALVFLILALMTGYSVTETERVVLTRLGSFVSVEGPGFHLRMPFVNSIQRFPIDIQALHQERVNTYTVDNQELNAAFTVNYRIPAEHVEGIYRNAQDYQARLTTLAIDRFKRQMGTYSVTDIAARRAAAAQAVFELLRGEAERIYGIQIIDFQINDISYTETFRRAVDQASGARVLVEQAEQVKRQREVEAATAVVQATGVANALREQAHGEADANVLRATAEAQAIRLRGEAEASAIRAQAEALANNSGLVSLRQAERWNGQLPSQMLQSVMPFMNIPGPR